MPHSVAKKKKLCTFILHVPIYLWTSIPFSELYALHVSLHSFLYYFKQWLILFETWMLPLLEITVLGSWEMCWRQSLHAIWWS